ncbi:MAG: DUF6384 family protein [Beijerinckiaceae bacterium]
MSTAVTTAEAKPQTLDEVMLAMDVVDTLRHQDRLVTRELDETRREAELIERLRAIYHGQGIEVPDEVIRQGVSAIKENRFVYKPPAPGLGVTLAKLWIARDRFGKAAGAALLALGLGTGGWWFGIEQPKRAEAARIEREITDIIPKSLTQAHQEAVGEARVEPARARAAALLADGQAALRRRDAEAGRKAITDLEALRVQLSREYAVRIVSRPGEPSVVWRVPQRNPNARNYYAVVEAIDANGRAIPLPILSEEDAQTTTVSKYGVRISAETYQAIARDKQDDGIVQRNRMGEKRRGELDVVYTTPVLGGFISKW